MTSQGEPELLARLRRAAATSPDTMLRFIDDDGVTESITIADFLARSERLAIELRSAGLGRGDLVAIRGAGCARSVAESILACIISGCVAVPLVSLLGDADVDVILEQSRPRAFLSDANIRGRDLRPFLNEVASRGASMVAAGIGELAESHPLPVVSPQPEPVEWGEGAAPGFVLFSSGTTGVPKGAIHSHASVLAEVEDFADHLGLTDGGVGLQPFPLGHIGGLAGLMLALCFGREFVFLSSWDAATAYDAIREYGVTATGSAPYFAQTLLEECERRGPGLPTLGAMVSGGGPVGRELVMRASALGIPLSRCYGSTEHPTACAHHSGDPLDVRADSDGRPTNGTEVWIVDTSNRECPIGTPGEVLLRGPEQFRGYLSGDNSGFVAGGWFRTGDLGVLDNAGYLTITGRMKEVIIRGGENIAVAEIEGLLGRIPGVLEAAVVGVPDERFGERAHAFVVRNPDVAPLTLDDIRSHFASMRVAKFKIPEFLTEVPTLPRNDLGKVQKHVLRKALTVR